MTLVLRPFGYETLTTLIFRLADQARVPEASVPGLFLVLCSLPGLIPLTYLVRNTIR
jgi:ABC-type Fe3+ transport system permease subunit